MKILHVQETLAPNYGGPAKVLPELAAEQARSGLEVEILTTNADTPRGQYHAAGKTCLPGTAVPVTYCSVWAGVLRFSPDVVRYFRENGNRFDLIHVHGLYRFPQSYAARFARKTGVPYIIRPHGSLDPYLFARSSRSLTLKRAYERLIDLPNLHAASAIHYTAEDERNLASFMNLRSPEFVVPNGLDWAAYESLPPRGAMRERLGLGERPVILFLGRLHHKKGLDILVEAFDVLHRQAPSARLVVVGPEPDGYGAEVRKWVAERGLEDAVVFAGAFRGKDVVQAFVDADLFALPSYTENFGMSVVEAMACEAPVIISNRVNIHAEVSDAGAGIVTRCDVDEVAAAMIALLEDGGKRRMLGQSGRRLVQRRFTWPSVVRSLEAEYERILRRQPAEAAAAAL